MLPDLRRACRAWLHRPGVSAAAIGSLAIGIGANAALLSLVDGLGLRPMQIDRPDRLVRVFSTRGASTQDDFSVPEFRDIEGTVPAFAATAAYGIRAVALTSRNRPADVAMLAVVSGNYFTTLGVRPAAGRLPGTGHADQPVAVISHKLWESRYAADPGAIDRGIELNGRPFAVAGVLPPDFAGLDPLLAPDVWIGFDAWPAVNGPQSDLVDRGTRWIKVVARLRDDASLLESSSQIATVMSRFERAHPATNAGRSSRVVLDLDYRRRIARVAGAALGAIGLFVLLLGCANVAGLLIARSEERRHEMAVRASIGAGRGRLIAQLLTESAVLAAAGVGAGIAIAALLIRLLPLAIPPSPVPIALAFRLDVRVAAFAALLGLVTVLVFGVGPALAGSRADAGAVLKDSAGGASRGRSVMRHLIVGGEIAVSLALIAVSVFLVRGISNLNRVDAGFERGPMLMVMVSPGAVGYDAARSRTYYDTLLDRVRALPGVERAALARRAPLSLSGGGAAETVAVPGYDSPPGLRGFSIHFNAVGQDYFQTIGTPLVRGRDFTDRDTRDAPRVAIVSQAFAARFWPGETALGRRVGLGAAGTPCDIVGIARDAKYNSLGEAAQPYIYFPLAQRPGGEATLLARVSGDERAFVAPLRQTMDAIDRGVPALQIETMRDHLHAAAAVERVTTVLVTALAAAALFLALVGLYALIAYLVGCRVREIGIRAALGASRSQIVRDVLHRAARPVGAGIAAGLVLARAVAAAVAGSIYGVTAGDPVVYLVASVLIVIVAAGATAVPARRAARLDPALVLRRD